MGRCITCGLSPSRDSCPVVVDVRLRKSHIKGECGFNKTTFAPFDVVVGYFTYGCKESSTPRFWWHDIPMDSLDSAKCTPKTRLQATAIFNGHKIVSQDLVADLQRKSDVGPFRDNMQQMIEDMKKEYHRRVDAAKAASRTALSEFSGDAAPGHGAFKRSDIKEESNMSSNARSGRSLQPVTMRKLSPVARIDALHTAHPLDSVPVPNGTANPSKTMSSTINFRIFEDEDKGLSSKLSSRSSEDLNPITVPAACIACDKPAHRQLGCPLIPGGFDSPHSLFDAATFEPMPVTFGHFTCMRRGNDGVVAGWKHFYCMNFNGDPPRLSTTATSPNRLDKLYARAILMGYPLDAVGPEDLERMTDRGPYFTTVQAFLASMVAEYTRRRDIANTARFPISFATDSPFKFSSVAQNMATPRATSQPRVIAGRKPGRNPSHRQGATRTTLPTQATLTPVEPPCALPQVVVYAPTKDAPDRATQDEPSQLAALVQAYSPLYDQVQAVSQEWATSRSEKHLAVLSATAPPSHAESGARRVNADQVPNAEAGRGTRTTDSNTPPVQSAEPDRERKGARPRISRMILRMPGMSIFNSSSTRRP